MPEADGPDAARPVRRRLVPGVGLFFLAPLVGEFLLGNQPITALPAVLLYAPMYGGGALLIREFVRPISLDWASAPPCSKRR